MQKTVAKGVMENRRSVNVWRSCYFNFSCVKEQKNKRWKIIYVNQSDLYCDSKDKICNFCRNLKNPTRNLNEGWDSEEKTKWSEDSDCVHFASISSQTKSFQFLIYPDGEVDILNGSVWEELSGLSDFSQEFPYD
jgi:hypothetical protein